MSWGILLLGHNSHLGGSILVSNVTVEDGKLCAQLLNLVKTGRWDLSGSEAEALVSTKRWLQSVAVQMAEQLRTPEASKPVAASTPPEVMKIKSMGSLPASNQSGKSTKMKKK